MRGFYEFRTFVLGLFLLFLAHALQDLYRISAAVLQPLFLGIQPFFRGLSTNILMILRRVEVLSLKLN